MSDLMTPHATDHDATATPPAPDAAPVTTTLETSATPAPQPKPRHTVRLPRTGPATIQQVIPGTYGRDSRTNFQWNVISVARLTISPQEAFDRWRATFDIPVFQIDHAPGSLILIQGRRRPLFIALTLDPDDSTKLVIRVPAATPASRHPGIMGYDLFAMWDEVLEALRLRTDQMIRIVPPDETSADATTMQALAGIPATVTDVTATA